MNADDARRVNALAWLAKARQDFERVGRCLDAVPPDPEDALFHCQQTAEKALKALLVWHDVPFRKTHDLSALGHQCAAFEPALTELFAQLDDLTEYATIYRYPGEFVIPAAPETDDARRLAQEILREVSRRVDPAG